MALEDARKFVEMAKNDEALREKLDGVQPEEVMAYAKELGLQFTVEELKDAVCSPKLSPEDMDLVAGGTGSSQDNDEYKDFDVGYSCKGSPDGKHAWVLTGHHEDNKSFACWDWSYGYDHYKCIRCGHTYVHRV